MDRSALCFANSPGASKAPEDRRTPRGLLLAGITLLTLTACDPGKAPDADAAAGDAERGIEKTFERGPVKIVLRVDDKEPTIADRIRLELEVTAAEDYNVAFPSFGEKLEQFGIVDYTTTQPELVDEGRTRRSRNYVLEPFLSGDYVIPPMKFTFAKHDAADAEEHVIETEEIKIKVQSLLAEDRENLRIHEIAPPVEFPRPSRAWLWWSLAGGAAVLVLAGILARWFIRRRKPEAFAAPPLPAHQIAFAQLEKLVAQDLPGKGRIKEFYQQLSDILRHYIENRFGLHAPEQTTEEFLFSLGRSDALELSHKELLKHFLLHCDLVKFAEHQPSTEDIQKTFDACRNFIVETYAEREVAAAPLRHEAVPAGN